MSFMASNLDRICTVDISLATPISNDANFDNILILGPPAANAVDMPDVGVYSSLNELTDCGVVATGDNADAIGVAARVAFSQSPRPTEIYVAAQKITEAAAAAKTTVSDVNSAIDQYLGTKEDLTGCTLTYYADCRAVAITLTGAASKVKNTGLFQLLSALIEQGYTVKLDGTTITGLDDVKNTAFFNNVSAMSRGDEPLFATVTVSKEGANDVLYCVNVFYPSTTSLSTADEVLTLPADIEDDPTGELEPIADTLARCLATDGWYCLCPVSLARNQLVEVIQWTETQNKLCGYIDNDPENPVVQAGLYLRSFPVYAKVTPSQADADIPAENQYGLAAAMAVKSMNFHAGEETWAMKQLATVTPSVLTSTFIKKLEEANINFFITIASRNMTQGGKTNGGEWIDIIRFRDWLQNDMQVRIVNLLVVNPKIPYTDAGISLVENQMIASLKSGQKYGGIAPTEYDSDGNANPGFVTSVPIAADITSTQKASRVLTDCRFSARIAGAIHMVEVKGCLTYESLQ